ncbi:MAG: hypothetical protein FH753_06320 [Firmicutes bacterium]|nr:hypothetical protein [Bacillota bacterium]
MKLDKDIILRLISGIVSIIGLIILIKSVNIGKSLANDYLLKFGSMDTERYLIMIKEYTTTFRWLGAILLIVGSFSTLRK